MPSVLEKYGINPEAYRRPGGTPPLAQPAAGNFEPAPPAPRAPQSSVLQKYQINPESYRKPDGFKYAKPGPYISSLSPEEAPKFQEWVKQNNVPYVPSTRADYDMPGFWKALQAGDERAKSSINQSDNRIHYPDTWKTPYHKTFSRESQYATPNAPYWKENQLVDETGRVLADETPKELPFIQRLKNYANIAIGGGKAIMEHSPVGPRVPFEMAEKGFKAAEPLVAKAPAPVKAAVGVARGVNDLAQGALHPKNLAIMVGAALLPEGIMAKAASGFFSYQMLKDLPEMQKKYTEAYNSGDYEKAARIGTQMVGSGFFGIAGLSHMAGDMTPDISENPVRPATPEESRNFTEQAVAEKSPPIPPERQLPFDSRGTKQAIPLPARPDYMTPEQIKERIMSGGVDRPALPSPGEASGAIPMGVRPGYLTPDQIKQTILSAGKTDKLALPAPDQAGGAIPLPAPEGTRIPVPSNKVDIFSYDNPLSRRFREVAAPQGFKVENRDGANFIDTESKSKIDRGSKIVAAYEPLKSENLFDPKSTQYENALNIAQDYYSKNLSKSEIKAPAFNGEPVVFPPDGLQYTLEGKARGQENIKRRLALLPKAEAVLRNTKYVDDIRDLENGTKRFGLLGRFEDGSVVRVIAQEINRAGKHFLSVFDWEDVSKKKSGASSSSAALGLDRSGVDEAPLHQSNESIPPGGEKVNPKNWPSNAGAALGPADAAARILELSKKAKDYAEFRLMVLQDADLNDTMKSMNVNLHQAYDKNQHEQGQMGVEQFKKVAVGQNTDPRRVTIEDLQNAAKPPKLEVIDNPPAKERSFIKTAREAEITDPAVADQIKGRYNPISNKETLEQAVQTINKNYEKALETVKSDKPADRVSVAMAEILIADAQSKGRIGEAIDIVEKTAKKLTDAGQTVQAAAIYNRMTPEGVLVYTQRLIDRVNKDHSGMKLKLEPDVADDLVNMSKKIAGMPDGPEKVIEGKRLLAKIREQIPPTFWQQVSTIQTMSQLLNPKTIIRNLIGNAGFQVAENVSDVAGATLDTFVGAITGKRSKTMSDLAAQGRGFVKGLKEGYRDATEGTDAGQGGKFDLPSGFTFKNKPMRALEKAMNIGLKATDRAFYEAGVQQSLSNQMRAAKVKEPTLEMEEIAHKDGLYRTFQDENVVSNMFTKLKKALNAGGQFGLGDFVLKYPKTPANILARGIDYSPAGYVNTLFELAQPLIGKEFNQKAFTESTSRATVGTATLIGTGAILHRLGIITGRREKDKEIAAVQREVGLGDYKINASALKRYVMSGMDPEQAKLREGDTMLNYDWFQPSSIGLSIGANIDENKGQPTGVVGTVLKGMIDAGDTLVEQPLLRGVKTLTSSGDLMKGLGDVLQGVPASFVPTFLNQVRTLIDNKDRETNDPSPIKEAENLVKKKIPGVAATLPPKVSTFGKDKEAYQNGTNSLFNVFLNPAFVSKYNPTPEAKMVLDIYNNSGETSQAPKIAAKSYIINGEKKVLTAKEYEAMQRFIGKETQERFSVLANNPSFMNVGDEQKAKVLQKILTEIGHKAKREVLGNKK